MFRQLQDNDRWHIRDRRGKERRGWGQYLEQGNENKTKELNITFELKNWK